MNLETGAPPIHPSSVTASCTSPAVSLPGRTAKRRAGQFDREFDFLLLCVTYAHGSRIEDIHKHIAEGLNWQALFEITRHHRLIPQVYTALRGIADLVPSEPLAKLHNLYQANIRQTLRLTRDLLRVMKHFESRGIPVLAYKGPALATILNGDISGRQFADLDLLVHPSAVHKSKAALAELGYTPQFSLTDHQEEIFIRSGYEAAFDLPDAQNVLELKWRILPRFYSIDFDVSGFFDRSITIEICNCPVRTMSPDDLLLVLCVHAAKHAWSELSLLWDISQLTRSQPIEWDRVHEQATRLGIRRILNMNLVLAHSLLGSPLPGAPEGRGETEPGIGVLMVKVSSAIAESQQVNTESSPYFRLMLSLRERWRDRGRFLWRLMMTPASGEWSLVSLPQWLFPLYYVVRMYRLARRLIGMPAAKRTSVAGEKFNTASA